MGRVYLAEHEAIQKKVALKVLRSDFSNKPDIVERFQQEAISASRIKHPNVLDVFDFGQLANGCFFLAMEHLEGIDLADELQQKKSIDPKRGVRFALQMCRALGAAHGRGVVHRDMKPENVFLQRTDDGDEVVKILDFGIAQLRTAEEAAATEQKRRITRTGMIFGTPEYMAPEQATGKKSDLRVDVYAVGVIMFEMFTGAVPFSADTFMAVLNAHAYQPLPNMRSRFPDLAITPQLQLVIERALAKDPEQRFQSMNDFSAALLLTPEGARFGSIRPPQAALPQPGAAAGGPIQVPDFPPSSPVPQISLAELQKDASPTLVAGTPPPPDSGARAQTQLGAEALGPASFRPRRRWGLAAATLLLLGGGAVAAVLFGPELRAGAVSTRPEPPLRRSPQAPEPAPAPQVEAPAAAPQPAPPASAIAPQVVLHVRTTPPAALLLKNGFQVCDSTPCDLNVAADETVVLEARRGTLRGGAKVIAQREQSVIIQLTNPAPSRAASTASKERLCEVEVDGLKILRPCAPR